MLNVGRIYEILDLCQGAHGDNGQAYDGCELVDVWRIFSLQIERTHQYEQEMIELLREWPAESWGQPIPPLGQQISYIQAGAVLDNQYTAFRLFAFGKLLGWWQIMDPTTLLGLSKSDPTAQQMVGAGLIAIVGYMPAS